MERPLSFYGRYSGFVHEHMWAPTVSRPNGQYGLAGFGRQHDAGMMVWATPGESNSEQHTGGREGAHPPVVLSTNKGVIELPSAVRRGGFSFAPTIRNMS